MCRLNYLILLIIFSSCSRQSITENGFIGSWTSVDKGFPYSATLIISSDSTFDFKYGACESRGFSMGTWKIKDGFIVLNSYKTDSCYYVNDFGVHCYKITDTIQWSRKTRKDCNIINEKVYTIFVNDQFEIRNDSLFHIEEQNDICTNLKGMDDIFIPDKN